MKCCLRLIIRAILLLIPKCHRNHFLGGSAWVMIPIHYQRTSRHVSASAIFLQSSKTNHSETIITDTRPHDHRATEARKARRLNHAFRHLYRHKVVNSSKIDDHSALSSREFLMKFGGYSDSEINNLQQLFPPLLGLDVQRHLEPKMRFLKHTLLEMHNESLGLPQDIRENLPPHYFGARLERVIAPRHAFLVCNNLPHGKELFCTGSGSSNKTKDENNLFSSYSRWQDFLKSCRNTKQFAALCNRWARETRQLSQNNEVEPNTITSKQIEAFDVLFGRGLMAAARNDLCQQNNAWQLEYVNVTSGEIIQFLIQHGANPLERDNRGVGLLHWAAGAGNIGGVKALLPHFLTAHGAGQPVGLFAEAERDGSTPLHWAAAGSTRREFGVGGHPEMCRYILQEVSSDSHGGLGLSPQQRTRNLVCQLTKDGNSALMWAAWSGTLDTVKYLIRNRADPLVANRNGCTVSHWAASGGNLEVCQYLAKTVGVNFLEPNNGGNTPLTHAVAFGREKVIAWLRNEIIPKGDDSDRIAASLAMDFVDWTEGQDQKRQEVLALFEDWYSDNQL